MVIILKQNAKQEDVNELLNWIKSQKIKAQAMEGESQRILGLIGNTQAIDINAVSTFPAVESVRRIAEPYKKANRKTVFFFVVLIFFIFIGFCGFSCN